MTTHDLDAIRWELAKRLEGMREACPQVTQWRDGTIVTSHAHAEDACPGYWPVPLTAEGLIDEGRLRRAIEAAGCTVERNTNRKWYVYPPFNPGIHTVVGNPILAIAYLTAVGAWPVKEAPHD